MNFTVFYNWLKYTIVTPSFFFKNRLFIEKSMQNRNIYADFTETHKSFTWSQLASTNVDGFWLKASRARFKLYILAVSIIGSYIFLRWVNVLPFPVFPAGQLLVYTLWRFFDGLYFWILQFEYLFITFSISLIFMLVNLTSSANLNLARWMEKYHAETPINNPSDSTKWSTSAASDLVKLHNVIKLRSLKSSNSLGLNSNLFNLSSAHSNHLDLETFNILRQFYNLSTLLGRKQNIFNSLNHQSENLNPLFSLLTPNNTPLALPNSEFINNMSMRGRLYLGINTELTKLETKTRQGFLTINQKLTTSDKSTHYVPATASDFVNKISLKNLHLSPAVFDGSTPSKQLSLIQFDNSTLLLLKMSRWMNMYNSIHKNDIHMLRGLNNNLSLTLDCSESKPTSTVKQLELSTEWVLNRLALLNNVLEADVHITKANMSVKSSRGLKDLPSQSNNITALILSQPLRIVPSTTSDYSNFWSVQNYLDMYQLINTNVKTNLSPTYKSVNVRFTNENGVLKSELNKLI